MSLAIEIKNNEIVLVDAKINKSRVVVKSTHTYEFSESLINQNGIVDIDTFALMLSQQVAHLDSKDKSANVCLNNSSIIYREIFVPKVDERRLPFLVRSEMMSALHLTQDYLIDFVPLEELVREGFPMYRMLAVAILESAVTSYLAAFKKAEIKISILDTATNAIKKMVSHFGLNDTEKQFVVADVQKGMLKLYLFDEGIYVLARNTRITPLSESNTAQVIDEISESISKMNQFSYTRNDRGIQNIIYVGIDSILETVKNQVEDTLEIPGSVFTKLLGSRGVSGLENKHVNAIGALLRK